MLRWEPVSNSKNDFVADINEGENTGRFRVKRVPRRRIKPWQASFKGHMRTGPKTVTTERQHNFVESEEAAKAICQRWAEGETIGSCLLKINEERKANTLDN